MYRVNAEQMPNWYQLKDNILINLFMDMPTKTVVKEVPKPGVIIAKTVELEQGRYNITKYLNFGQYNKTVMDFYQHLEACFSDYNLSAFYRNMKTLTLTTKKRNFSDYLESLIVKQPASATYYNDTNTVHITEEEKKPRPIIPIGQISSSYSPAGPVTDIPETRILREEDFEVEDKPAKQKKEKSG